MRIFERFCIFMLAPIFCAFVVGLCYPHKEAMQWAAFNGFLIGLHVALTARWPFCKKRKPKAFRTKMTKEMFDTLKNGNGGLKK